MLAATEYLARGMEVAAAGQGISVPVGKEIAPQFYQAVAEVLAYVYRVAAKAA